ncbi:cyclopropane-fatty-acyl-phospholipid synthase [Xanthobacter flavus]|uniref:Cyclopropane-fatty-acyl-phospholipid synthase n=2 Tax=Hyphomicrobiales TaxID=356 RepID=A0A7W9FN38_9HYPH|nr:MULTISPECIES: cyclopropane-fatty-acyl-phospholipid synthase family protein [Hyphomicrobiales]MBB5753691.1 cyclopropane-fatty-acyl-phospholipid synthase [Prosthecomicrobium pneumaticum]MBN8914756.1 class I SAM-dependent methyltransferase [Hyphomicrobiales bacterium]MDR6336846.1 cyclopropane-fatty-acyl-phospholipid synthase [Xanthobacter flavus]GLI25515.1 cyclopropane-fatty-acyl-phospholipid synthase [Xanthobacter flavus]
MLLLRKMLGQIIHDGRLTVIAPNGGIHHIGNGTPSITIRIVDPAVIPRLLLNPDLALGEAYMDGALLVDDGDIYGFLDICFSNIGSSSGQGVRRARASLSRLVRRFVQHNPIPVARANVAHHYDLSDTLYEQFLDADRQYSCAYYNSSDDTLERAQEQKKRHLAAKLLLSSGQRILDIGSGWGGLSLYLAQIAAVDVTGLTLSTEQHAYSERRAAETGLGDRVRFLLKDYRQEEGRYDRIVSVGMFEHVGVGHYREYFKKVRSLLTNDGVAMIHTIGRADGPGAANAWINKYIFPGGYVPALSEILPAIEQAGLYVTDIEILRLHYAETLKAWRQRFIANRGRVAEIYDQRFCLMWEFYLASCEAAFRHGGLINFQIQVSKRVNAAPLTRDYIQNWERLHKIDAADVDVPAHSVSHPAKSGGFAQ